MKFGQDKIIEIKSNINIEDLISEYITLKKSGRTYFGLCPFHNEKTASFSVNSQKQFFCCFGCGEKGDVFSFMQKIEGINFYEALIKLANRTGIVLEALSDEEAIKASKKSLLEKNLYKINSIANKFFTENFIIHKDISNHFLGSRGLSTDDAKSFELGYAPDLWDGLTNYLYKNNVPLDLAAMLGLIKIKPSANSSSTNPSDYYDCFRHRIVFPIIDISNKTIGFSCRRIESGADSDNSNPKYINSPESIIFKKRENLYGINNAYRKISELDEVIVVEGNLDCIKISSIGTKNVIATLGTALTVNHLKRLKRFSSNIILIFDGDKAGKDATEKAFELAASLELNSLKTISLPKETDPDSFIKNFGSAKFNELLKNSKYLTEHLIENILTSIKDPTATEKVDLFKKCENYINKIIDPLARQSYYKYIEKNLGLTSPKKNQPTYSKNNKRTYPGNLITKDKPDKTEKTIIEILLNYPIINTPSFKKIISFEIFEKFSSPEYNAIGTEFLRILSTLDFDSDININLNENNYQNIITNILTTKLSMKAPGKTYGLFIEAISNPTSLNDEDVNEVLSDCIDKILSRQKEKLVELAKEKIRKAENEQNDTETLSALNEYQKLVRKQNAFEKEL